MGFSDCLFNPLKSVLSSSSSLSQICPCLFRVYSSPDSTQGQGCRWTCAERKKWVFPPPLYEDRDYCNPIPCAPLTDEEGAEKVWLCSTGRWEQIPLDQRGHRGPDHCMDGMSCSLGLLHASGKSSPLPTMVLIPQYLIPWTAEEILTEKTLPTQVFWDSQNKIQGYT